MRIMFQPDALHHQAPSNHTRHHHTLSGSPEKTSGFNIPNAPTASPHAARRTPHAARRTLHATRYTLHAARAAYNHKAAVVGEIIASSIKTRYRIAPFPTQPPARLSSTTAPNAPHLHGPSSPTPRPHQDAARPHTSSYATPDPEAQRINAASPIPPSPHLSPPHLSPPHLSPPHLSPPHLSRHISPATSLPTTSLPATSTPPPRPKPSTAASMRSHIGPRPTRIQRFLHMLPTQPH